jgi:Gelsolin repeat
MHYTTHSCSCKNNQFQVCALRGRFMSSEVVATAAAAARTKLNWNDSLPASSSSPEQLRARIQQAAAAEGAVVSFAAVGHTPGSIHVGRIVNYTIAPWTAVGTFHKGDCYVILHTRTTHPPPPAAAAAIQNHQAPQQQPQPQQLVHEIYIWIGNESTPDEYGTAAYKVWLFTLLVVATESTLSFFVCSVAVMLGAKALLVWNTHSLSLYLKTRVVSILRHR